MHSFYPVLSRWWRCGPPQAQQRGSKTCDTPCSRKVRQHYMNKDTSWCYLMQFFDDVIFFTPTPLFPVLLKGCLRCVWVLQKRPLLFMKHAGRSLRPALAPFTAGGSKKPWHCHLITELLSFDYLQQRMPEEIRTMMRGAALRCSICLRRNDSRCCL